MLTRRGVPHGALPLKPGSDDKPLPGDGYGTNALYVMPWMLSLYTLAGTAAVACQQLNNMRGVCPHRKGRVRQRAAALACRDASSVLRWHVVAAHWHAAGSGGRSACRGCSLCGSAHRHTVHMRRAMQCTKHRQYTGWHSQDVQWCLIDYTVVQCIVFATSSRWFWCLSLSHPHLIANSG